MIAQSNTIDVHSTKQLFPAYIFFGVIYRRKSAVQV